MFVIPFLRGSHLLGESHFGDFVVVRGCFTADGFKNRIQVSIEKLHFDSITSSLFGIQAFFHAP